MNKKAIIIVGLGYGDEGKGLTTDYFCRISPNPLVIRYNGGHQAGHTVVLKNGSRHVFSNFGSGTLAGVSTYWSNFCTFAPFQFLEEYRKLYFIPPFYLDIKCPVTTHYDILFNRALEKSKGNLRSGSCGLGFGATLHRHTQDFLQLTTDDLRDINLTRSKLSQIRAYYKNKIETETNYYFDQFDHDSEDILFLESVAQIIKLISNGFISLVTENEIFSNKEWHTYIFEGAQGILLDPTYGIPPYVTKSNTTSQNAIKILNRNFETEIETNICYVTRAYATRHGAGPFKSCEPVTLINGITIETNNDNEYQGKFNVGYLNVNLLNYAIGCDERHSFKTPKLLMITCIDQVISEQIPVLINNTLHTFHYSRLPTLLNCNFTTTIFSNSCCSENLI